MSTDAEQGSAADAARPPLTITATDDARLKGRYAVVEIMGHRRRVGRVSEIQKYGAAFCRVEPLLDADGTLGPPEDYSGAAIFAEHEIPLAQALEAMRPWHASLVTGEGDVEDDEPDDKPDGEIPW